MALSLERGLYFLIALVLAIDVHECLHAWMANQLGDPTAKYMGRISLNPMVHLDPLGGLMMVLMAFRGAGFAWGKPVPVNPNNFRNGPIVGEAMVSASGPLANLLMAAVVAVPLRLAINDVLPSTILDGRLGQFLLILFIVNISLALFNLLPIFPLDGYHFWLGILHELPFGFTRQIWFALSGGPFQTYGPMILLLLIFMGGGILSRILNPAFSLLSTLLLGTPLR